MNDWQDAEERVEKAHELFEQRRWVEALDELRAAIALNPYNSSWFFNSGLILDELGRHDEALKAYQDAVEIDGDDLHALNHLGVDQCRLGMLKEAIATFARVQEIDPAFEPAYCNRIIAYGELGDHDKAEEMFYLARLYKDDCPNCYYNMGCSLAMRGLFDKAVFCFQRTLDLDEEHPEVHERIAEALWSKGDREAARQHYLIGLRQNPGNVRALLDLGDLLLEMGRVEDAGEKFRRAIELSPEDPSAYFCNGCWLVHCKRDAEAAENFRKTLELDPTYPGAHLRLGELLQSRGETEQCRKELRKELLLHPADPPLLVQLGDLLLNCQESRAAVACFKRLVGIEPERVAGWQNLAVAQFARGAFAEGIESCMEALKREPGNLITLYNLALAHERLGKYDHALVWVRRGLKISPADVSLQKLGFRIRAMKLKSWVGRAIGSARLLWPIAGKHRGA